MKVTFCALCKNKNTLIQIYKQAIKFFPEETQYILIDNTDKLTDSYLAIKKFFKEAKGEIIIISHDDIQFDHVKYSDLTSELKKVNNKYPNAVLYGVAGCTEDLKNKGHFFTTDKENKLGIKANKEELWEYNKNKQIISLDECFLIIRNGTTLNVSEQLTGYHFYGTDLCHNAKKIGKTCHVINFPVTHLSHGRLDENFYTAKELFEIYILTNQSNIIIKTTCTYLYAGKNLIKKIYAAFLSWKMVEKHPDCRSARRCINSRAYKIIGPIWSIIIFIAELIENLITLKSIFHTNRRKLKKALFGERKRTGKGEAQSR